MRAIIVIPARLNSSRLPGKVLLADTGEPLVAMTIRRARETGWPVVLATDSVRVASVVSESGACPVVVDKTPRWCGSQRVAHALDILDIRHAMDYDVVIDWQADEPLVDPASVVAAAHLAHERRCIATIAAPLDRPGDIHDPDIVKVAVDEGGCCHEFGRLPSDFSSTEGLLHHIGIYCWPRRSNRRIAEMAESHAAAACRLEQLSWLDVGWRIHTVVAERAPLSINSREDYDRLLLELESMDD